MSGKEIQNALDNICSVACAVDSRACHFLHAGRIHPHPIGLGDCDHPDPSHSGTKGNFLIGWKTR